jgi:hypothetical protein
MTINKSQGQTFRQRTGIFLPRPVFSHGHLYVALSRAPSRSTVRVVVHRDGDVQGYRGSRVYTLNVVNREYLGTHQVTSSAPTAAEDPQVPPSLSDRPPLRPTMSVTPRTPRLPSELDTAPTPATRRTSATGPSTSSSTGPRAKPGVATSVPPGVSASAPAELSPEGDPSDYWSPEDCHAPAPAPPSFGPPASSAVVDPDDFPTCSAEPVEVLPPPVPIRPMDTTLREDPVEVVEPCDIGDANSTWVPSSTRPGFPSPPGDIGDANSTWVPPSTRSNSTWVPPPTRSGFPFTPGDIGDANSTWVPPSTRPGFPSPPRRYPRTAPTAPPEPETNGPGEEEPRDVPRRETNEPGEEETRDVPRDAPTASREPETTEPTEQETRHTRTTLLAASRTSSLCANPSFHLLGPSRPVLSHPEFGSCQRTSTTGDGACAAHALCGIPNETGSLLYPDGRADWVCILRSLLTAEVVPNGDLIMLIGDMGDRAARSSLERASQSVEEESFWLALPPPQQVAAVEAMQTVSSNNAEAGVTTRRLEDLVATMFTLGHRDIVDGLLEATDLVTEYHRPYGRRDGDDVGLQRMRAHRPLPLLVLRELARPGARPLGTRALVRSPRPVGASSPRDVGLPGFRSSVPRSGVRDGAGPLAFLRCPHTRASPWSIRLIPPLTSHTHRLTGCHHAAEGFLRYRAPVRRTPNLPLQ